MYEPYPCLSIYRVIITNIAIKNIMKPLNENLNNFFIGFSAKYKHLNYNKYLNRYYVFDIEKYRYGMG